MLKLNYPFLSFFFIRLFSATMFMLVFLIACPYEPKSSDKSSEMKIHIIGRVTNKADGSPIANVEVQLTSSITKVLRTTNTNEDGQYSITYNGKCNRGDRGTTLYVRVRSPEGYYPQPPDLYLLECKEETQTFNFQLILQHSYSQD